MSNGPLVGIVMGSDSDWPKMEAAGKQLEELGISYEARVISAHRTPAAAEAWARGAVERGTKVIIAAAGGAAHLAGVMAAFTPLPVIAVPISSGALQGMDSLLAMVQMPPGVPVATVAIDGSKNAALLAVQIIGTGDDAVRARIVDYKEKMRKTVEAKDAEFKTKHTFAG